MKPTANQRGGVYSLTEDMEIKAKLFTLTRRLEELEGRRSHEVRAVEEAPVPIQPSTTSPLTTKVNTALWSL